MTGWIGISLGDVGGIGPEVTLKALANQCAAGGSTRYLLLGDEAVLRGINERFHLGFQLEDYTSEATSSGRFFVHNPYPGPLPHPITPGSPAAARAALSYLRAGAEKCLRQELDALVTAPVNKESILRLGEPFVGQTEFLSQLAGTERTAMMLLGDDDRGRWLRVALATTHIPLRLVGDSLSQAKIETVIELTVEACLKLGLGRSKIAVCGLNPHAGEGGHLGTEERTIIEPAVAAVRARNLDAHGPFAADTLFHEVFRGDYDAVVAMYHDQGLVPLKMIGFDRGVNWTLGLPFIRTSPDHGTAYDIAGKGKANASSMLAALRLAETLAQSEK